nr:DUF3265 domain-containing protein [Vibrio vulnificus]
MTHNKAFKRDSCRAAFLVGSEFCGESCLRKLGLYGIHPLTQRYVPEYPTFSRHFTKLDLGSN